MNDFQKPRNALKAAELIRKAINLLEEDDESFKSYFWSIRTMRGILKNMERKEFTGARWKKADKVKTV